MKLARNITAMLLLSAAAFAVLGFLVQVRVGRPVATPGPVITDLKGLEPEAALMEGIRESLAAAQQAFTSSRRTTAVRALDAAMRASEVGKECAAEQETRNLFNEAHTKVMQARVALQNGSQTKTARLIHAAIESADKMRISMREPAHPSGTGSSADLNRYKGATVLNINGVRLGEVKGVQNGRPVLLLGGVTNLFGFINYGGREVAVDASRVLLGKRKRLGTTFVAVATRAAPSDGQLMRQPEVSIYRAIEGESEQE